MEGFVVRIFRDQDRILHWGKRVGFDIPIINTEGRGEPALDGALCHDWEWIGRARWLEAFLQFWDGKIELVRSQVAPIRRPTLRPVCGPETKGFLCEGNLRSRER